MTLEADHIIDRRRLKRRLTFWRLVAIAVAVSAGVIAVTRFDLTSGGDHVARLYVDGLIFNDEDRSEAIAKVRKNKSAKALMVVINSPGGTFVGSEILYKDLLEVAEKKPVIAVMEGTAASGGYMTALAADHIIAHAGTLTGSIGVIMQTADITGLLDKIGVKPETVKSGPLKAQPNPMEEFSLEARAATQNLLQDLFNMFIDMVTERRKLSRDVVEKLADGRVYSGRQAQQNGLIDAIGDQKTARKWLEDNRKVPASLPFQNVKIEHEDEPWRDIFGGTLGKMVFSERLRLDGIIALWHPEL